MFGKDNFFIQDPKASFFVGIAAGIGVISVIGFIILLVNLFGDGSFEKIGKSGNNGDSGNPPPTVVQPPTAGGVKNIAVNDGDYIRGNEDAKITIVEFSDFECPFCSRFHPTLQQAMGEYGDDVRWVYKHFPLDSIHPQARPAAEASECAGEQGKFWEYSDELFANQASLGDAYFKQLASQQGLNTSKFNDCLASGKYADKVEADYQAGIAAGVRGTPTSFINGQEINGAQPYASVKAAIDSLL
jgi:protein-disulfide isomerase